MTCSFHEPTPRATAPRGFSSFFRGSEVYCIQHQGTFTEVTRWNERKSRGDEKSTDACAHCHARSKERQSAFSAQSERRRFRAQPAGEACSRSTSSAMIAESRTPAGMKPCLSTNSNLRSPHFKRRNARTAIPASTRRGHSFPRRRAITARSVVSGCSSHRRRRGADQPRTPQQTDSIFTEIESVFIFVKSKMFFRWDTSQCYICNDRSICNNSLPRYFHLCFISFTPAYFWSAAGTFTVPFSVW